MKTQQEISKQEHEHSVCRPKKYLKISPPWDPVDKTVEAVQFHGDNHIGHNRYIVSSWLFPEEPEFYQSSGCETYTNAKYLFKADSGDYIVKDAEGEITALKPYIFKREYKLMESTESEEKGKITDEPEHSTDKQNKYRRKEIYETVEAVQFFGDSFPKKNKRFVWKWLYGKNTTFKLENDINSFFCLEAFKTIYTYDYVVKRADGKVSVLKPGDFEVEYELIESTESEEKGKITDEPEHRYITLSRPLLYQLNIDVSDKLQTGWKTVGGVSAVVLNDEIHYLQAMVKVYKPWSRRRKNER